MSYYDILLAKQLSGGGGGDITVESLSVTENGTYTAPSGKAYSPVVANVPNSYTASDEGKVVSSGALVAQTSQSITENGTYDTTLNDEVVVNVSGGGGGPSNVISGTFTGTESGILDISLPYNGNGFPVEIYIYSLPYPDNPNGAIIANLIMSKVEYVPFDSDVSTSKTFTGYKTMYNTSDQAYKKSSISSATMYGTTVPTSSACSFVDNTTLRVKIAAASGSSMYYKYNHTYNYRIIYSE